MFGLGKIQQTTQATAPVSPMANGQAAANTAQPNPATVLNQKNVKKGYEYFETIPKYILNIIGLKLVTDSSIKFPQKR